MVHGLYTEAHRLRREPPLQTSPFVQVPVITPYQDRIHSSLRSDNGQSDFGQQVVAWAMVSEVE
jgi:hypothetical protein